MPSVYQASLNFISLILVFADVSGCASYIVIHGELDLFIVLIFFILTWNTLSKY